jgi:kynureninase
MNFENTLEFARTMDAQDPLRDFRDRFIFPESSAEHPVYFTGNSLGLQPKTLKPLSFRSLKTGADSEWMDIFTPNDPGILTMKH